MYNRDRISFLSLSLLCSTLSFGGDTPQIPNYVTMVNKNPSTSPQMPQINPQNPQSPPTSNNGVGSSTASGVLGLIIDAGKPNPPDIKKLRKDQYEATFQELLQKYGPTKDLMQFYPEMFDSAGNLIGKNGPVYGFGEITQVAQVTRTARTEVVPVVTPVAPVIQSSTPVSTVTSALIPVPSPFKTPAIPAPSVSTPDVYAPKYTVPTVQDIMKPKTFIKPMDFQAPKPPADNGPGFTELATGAGATVGMWGSIKAGAATVGTYASSAGAYAWGLACAHPYVAIGTAIGTGAAGALYYFTRPAKVPLAAPIIQQITHEVPAPHEPVIKPHPNLPANLQPSDNPIKLGKRIFQPGPKPGQGDRPHGYKDQWGHYRHYTPENVAAAIESVEKGIWHGQNPTSGKHIYTYECPKTGLQKWAEVGNDGGILNCGINEVRHTVYPQTKEFLPPAGFVKPRGKDTGWVDKTLKGIAMVGISSTMTQPMNAPLILPTPPPSIPLPTSLSLPPAPRDITVHDLYAERMIKNHALAMEQKKIEVVQNKINESNKL